MTETTKAGWETVNRWKPQNHLQLTHIERNGPDGQAAMYLCTILMYETINKYIENKIGNNTNQITTCALDNKNGKISSQRQMNDSEKFESVWNEYLQEFIFRFEFGIMWPTGPTHVPQMMTLFYPLLHWTE